MTGIRLVSIWIAAAFLVLVAACTNDPYCPEGTSWCWAQCVDLMNDEDNCGSCDNHCGPDEDCVDGKCKSVNICTCISDDDCGDDSCCFEDCVCAHKDCTGLECGPDPVCSLDCGTCLSCERCNQGLCEPIEDLVCTTDADCMSDECCMGCLCLEMDCTDLECGLDPVCGMDCGPCQAGETCEDGTCTTTNIHDADGDGYIGEEWGGDDCDDTDPDVNPGEHEGPFGDFSCADGIDNDCDMMTDILDPDCCNCSQDGDCDDGNVCTWNYCADCMCLWELEPDGTPCGGGGESCVNGVCGCTPGFTDCGEYCADIWTDPDNCGACGLVCDSPWPFECRCNYGVCDCPDCYADCDGNTSNGDETDVCEDVNHCGWCTNVCDVGQVCIDAECEDSVVSCDPPCPVGSECLDLDGICEPECVLPTGKLACSDDSHCPIGGDCKSGDYCHYELCNCATDDHCWPDAICVNEEGWCGDCVLTGPYECVEDSDCVVAIDISRCCGLPKPRNVTTVQDSACLVEHPYSGPPIEGCEPDCSCSEPVHHNHCWPLLPIPLVATCRSGICRLNAEPGP